MPNTFQVRWTDVAGTVQSSTHATKDEAATKARLLSKEHGMAMIGEVEEGTDKVLTTETYNKGKLTVAKDRTSENIKGSDKPKLPKKAPAKGAKTAAPPKTSRKEAAEALKAGKKAAAEKKKADAAAAKATAKAAKPAKEKTDRKPRAEVTELSKAPPKGKALAKDLTVKYLAGFKPPKDSIREKLITRLFASFGGYVPASELATLLYSDAEKLGPLYMTLKGFNLAIEAGLGKEFQIKLDKVRFAKENYYGVLSSQ